MYDLPHVSQVHLASASSPDVTRGILGRVRMVVNGLVVEGVALRRTLDGRLTLAYPTRRDADGDRHFVVRPVDDRIRLAIEVQVFTALGVKPEELSS